MSKDLLSQIAVAEVVGKEVDGHRKSGPLYRDNAAPVTDDHTAATDQTAMPVKSESCEFCPRSSYVNELIASRLADNLLPTGEYKSTAQPRMLSSFDLSLLDTHGNMVEIRQQMLDLSTLAKERSATQKAASRLRFLTPWMDEQHLEPTCSIRPNSESMEDSECQCQSTRHFGTALGEFSRLSQPTSGEAFSCTCELMDDFKMGLTTAGAIPNCTHYVAISYCWERPEYDTENANTSSNASVSQPLEIVDNSIHGKTQIRLARAPPHVLRRAARYAASKECGLIWIDQECIKQDDRDDKENGIQSMDRVYSNSKYPVGILKLRLQTQEELDAFALLASDEMTEYGRSVMEGVPWERIIHLVPGDEMQQVTMFQVLLAIVSDRWFTRSWITQEALCSTEMVLIFEYDTSLKVPSATQQQIPGEAQISLRQLLNSIWWSFTPPLVVALSERPDLRENLLRVFFKVYPYTQHRPFQMSRYTCTMLSAWYMLSQTTNSRLADRLAIVANLCDYPIRINSMEAEMRGYNLDICLITQALLNGDMDVFWNRPTTMDFRGVIAAKRLLLLPLPGTLAISISSLPSITVWCRI